MTFIVLEVEYTCIFPIDISLKYNISIKLSFYVSVYTI